MKGTASPPSLLTSGGGGRKVGGTPRRRGTLGKRKIPFAQLPCALRAEQVETVRLVLWGLEFPTGRDEWYPEMLPAAAEGCALSLGLVGSTKHLPPLFFSPLRPSRAVVGWRRGQKNGDSRDDARVAGSLRSGIGKTHRAAMSLSWHLEVFVVPGLRNVNGSV